MKRFSRPLFSWQEPALFAALTRDRHGWILRGPMAPGICLVMLLGFDADRARKGRGPKFGKVEAVLLSAIIGPFLTAMRDVPDLNRQVTISDDSTNGIGNTRVHFSMHIIALGDIGGVSPHLPAGIGRSLGVKATVKGRGATTDVPTRLPMEWINDALHRLGVQVNLSGWDPLKSEAETSVQTGLLRHPGTGYRHPATAQARIEPLSDRGAGRRLPRWRTRVKACVPATRSIQRVNRAPSRQADVES